MTDTSPIPAATRRTVLRAAGLAALAGGGAAALAACSTDTPAAAPATSSPPATSSAPAAGGLSVAKAEVPVGGGVILEDADYVVTQPSRGEYKAFSKICTHQGCPVAEVVGAAIKCNCHGSEYSIEDGSVINPPATEPLKEATVTDSGDNVVITA